MVGLYEPLNVRAKSLGQGMELKVFWGINNMPGATESYILIVLILMGAWCEAVTLPPIKTTKSQVQHKGGKLIMGSTMQAG